ncbi:hypothetical protein BX265_0196 [Streptomyces sp. TLI_235]|nr:hypothetical protein [Streptomyces sp. TLI_235]PBC75529.1 hypothetical protein BX265_0196 [Streptomyces sp. TLI_235]
MWSAPGSGADLPVSRSCEPRARTVGIVAAQTTLELAAALHHAVRSDDTAPAAAVHERLIDLARGG